MSFKIRGIHPEGHHYYVYTASYKGYDTSWTYEFTQFKDVAIAYELDVAAKITKDLRKKGWIKLDMEKA